MSQELSEIKLGERAFQRHQNIIKAKKTLGLSYLQLGKLLLEMKESGDYRRILGEDLGERKGAWYLYLQLPEVSIAPSTARGLILVFQKWVKELGLPEEEVQEIDRRKLLALVPIVDKDNFKDWLLEAKTLSRNDLFQRIRQRGIEPIECTHEWEELPTWKCKICGETTHLNPFKRDTKQIETKGSVQK